MKIEVYLKDIQTATENENIEWKRHALERMIERDIRRNDIFTAILKGEIIETYDFDKPFPSVLILGYISKRPMHVVLAYNSVLRLVYIITIYEPTEEYWEKGFKQRKKQ